MKTIQNKIKRSVLAMTLLASTIHLDAQWLPGGAPPTAQIDRTGQTIIGPNGFASMPVAFYQLEVETPGGMDGIRISDNLGGEPQLILDNQNVGSSWNFQARQGPPRLEIYDGAGGAGLFTM